MSDTDESLRSHVNYIGEQLEAAVRGDLYCIDGDEVIIEDIDEWKQEEHKKAVEEFKNEHPESDGFDKDLYDTYEKFVEDEVGSAEDVEEPESMDLQEYLEKIELGDVRYEIDSGMEFLSGKTLITCGGPTIWVTDDYVEGYWGSSECSYPLDSQTREMLYDIFSERYNMSRDI